MFRISLGLVSWKNATYAHAVESHGKTRNANAPIRYASIVAPGQPKPSNTGRNVAFPGKATLPSMTNQCCTVNYSYRGNAYATIPTAATRCISKMS